MLAQFVHLVDGVVDVFNDDTFGDFQAQAACRDGMLADSAQHVAHEVGMAELPGADVYAEAECVRVDQLIGQQPGDALAGPGKNPAAGIKDQAALLQDVDKR